MDVNVDVEFFKDNMENLKDSNRYYFMETLTKQFHATVISRRTEQLRKALNRVACPELKGDVSKATIDEIKRELA